ncbi:hypothetical protein [Lentzea kentuckyensis]|uniref:hypothetical protein n=1 Tax=Lentzea kentuckyensis TaxID=360086 RepID=UPI000A3862DC|nr:hypothetical protein [Lentzea kentuckyensis]
MPINNLAKASPNEIDAELARLNVELTKAEQTLVALRKRRRDRIERGEVDLADELVVQIEQACSAADACEAAAMPFEQEFTRRGGWTRAWLVLNTGGHVHRTTACRTCFPTTKFAWLTHLSGRDEVEIVDLAGKAACTECYPSAPVEVRNQPSRIKTSEQLAQSAGREQRARAKAAKAISSPDGTPLRTKHCGLIETEFTARRSYADLLSYARYLTRQNVVFHRASIAEHQEDARLILAALSAKHGRTEDDLREELAPKVEAKWTREHSKWG